MLATRPCSGPAALASPLQNLTVPLPRPGRAGEEEEGGAGHCGARRSWRLWSAPPGPFPLPQSPLRTPADGTLLCPDADAKRPRMAMSFEGEESRERHDEQDAADKGDAGGGSLERNFRGRRVETPSHPGP